MDFKDNASVSRRPLPEQNHQELFKEKEIAYETNADHRLIIQPNQQTSQPFLQNSSLLTALLSSL
jgi:hypothetical protein